jgi:hypothetical protein
VNGYRIPLEAVRSWGEITMADEHGGDGGSSPTACGS